MFFNVVYAGRITEATPISEVLLNALNFLLTIIGIVAIIMLVIAGIVYLTAQGDYQQIDRAKKMTTYAIFGIIIALGSIIIVKQIIRFLN